MSRPFVSVVTPVYNGALYLAECIESILRQTHRELEYVIADNASTDDSLAIARAYAERDERVRVVAFDEHLSNHIANWNRTLSLISPRAHYVKVVHADDWIYEQCIEAMVATAEQHPSAGIVSAYRMDEDRVTLADVPPETTLLPGVEVARSFLLGGPLPFLFGSPTSLLLRADVVRAHDPFYDDQVIHADNEACMLVLAESDFAMVHRVLTYTRRHNEAVTAFTKRVGTPVPENVELFQRWGPRFLTQDEYDRKLVVRLINYAGYLLSNPRKWIRREFRSYHRQKIGQILARTSARELGRGVRLQLKRSLSGRR